MKPSFDLACSGLSNRGIVEDGGNLKMKKDIKLVICIRILKYLFFLIFNNQVSFQNM